MRLDINANDLMTVLSAARRGANPEDHEPIKRVTVAALVACDLAMQREDEVAVAPI